MHTRTRKVSLVVASAAAFFISCSEHAQAATIDTGPIVLRDFFAPGSHLNSGSIAGGSGQFSGGFSSLRAFDGNLTTDWASDGDIDANLFIDINLGGSQQVGGFFWENRAGALDNVETLDLILSQNATFGDADDVNVGRFNVGGNVGAKHGFVPRTANFVRFQGVDTADSFNPGADEIQLFRNRQVNTPVQLRDFFGAGQNLSADVVDFHSEFSGGFVVENAFDGLPTDWASFRGDLAPKLFIDIDLTVDAPNGVVLDRFLWDNRNGSLDFVQTMQVILSVDSIFGNGDDTVLGLFNVDGAGPATHSLGGVFANFIRFQAIDTAPNFNPGAQEIQLFGSRFVVVPEPATASLALLGLGGLMMRRRRMA